MLSFFPRGVLDEILNLIESVYEDFPSYSLVASFSEDASISVRSFDVDFQRSLLI